MKYFLNLRNPLNNAINVNNTSMIRLLMSYDEKHDILLRLNEVRKKQQWQLFSIKINMKNKSTFKILTCYTEKYHILLELNESNNIDFMGVILIPILNDVELFKLVRDY
ncbi:hypothetical protein U3516DRAFT_833753 [Neocallimastix sp. 'constans']